MGHREQLIEGAKRCLAEKGYLRTTARDIVAASGTNLASIGYHFGSKEALLTEAMTEALSEWGDEMERALSHAQQTTAAQRLEAMWTAIAASFRTNPWVWNAGMEVAVIAEQQPGLKAQLAQAHRMARVGLTAIFLGLPEDQVDEQAAGTIGSFLLCIVPGMLAQYMMEPETSPTGPGMIDGLRQIIEIIQRSELPPSPSPR